MHGTLPQCRHAKIGVLAANAEGAREYILWARVAGGERTGGGAERLAPRRIYPNQRWELR
jgi:hypothetical protein